MNEELITCMGTGDYVEGLPNETNTIQPIYEPKDTDGLIQDSTGGWFDPNDIYYIDW